MSTPKRLLKTLALSAAALGALSLTACGTQTTGGGPAGAGPVAAKPAAAVTATPSPRMVSGKDLERHPDPIVRAQAIAVRITNTCAPGTAMELPPLPEVSGLAEPATGTPPVPPVPSPPADVPVELPSDLPPPPGPEAAVPYDEVPLNEVDRCAADAHADRVRGAFAGGAPADEAALRKALAGVDYLPENVHRMPGGGALRVRIDLRDLSPNDNLALEVTATATGVRVDAFGAPLPGGPDITEIRRTGTA
ncbi:hypothetical protein ACF1CG_15245 [Streptomyces sp. NPDC014773]|uniref:hypothetical protein n=1 Tax=Streptomyces sp. NPDC014773 TaxID=3364908 RepID=UPI0036F59C4A